MAIGLVLGQQVVQSTLQLPFEIQARVSQTIDTTIDTRITPFALATCKKVQDLLNTQEASFTSIQRTIQDTGTNTLLGIRNHSKNTTLALEGKLDNLAAA